MMWRGGGAGGARLGPGLVGVWFGGVGRGGRVGWRRRRLGPGGMAGFWAGGGVAQGGGGGWGIPLGGFMAGEALGRVSRRRACDQRGRGFVVAVQGPPADERAGRGWFGTKSSL